MISRFKLFWASLPHQLQAAIVTFISVSAATIVHAIEDGGFTWSAASVKHLMGTAVVSGLVALRVFYMLPNGTGKAALLTSQVTAEKTKEQL